MAYFLVCLEFLTLVISSSQRYNMFFFCPRSHIAHSPLCTSTSILNTKVDLYMPCEAMAHSPKFSISDTSDIVSKLVWFSHLNLASSTSSSSSFKQPS